MVGKQRRRRGEALTVPSELLGALERMEGGPLDASPLVERIARGVGRLNAGLTRDREALLASAYMDHQELSLAYRTYYLCANAPKLWPILERLDQIPLPAGTNGPSGALRPRLHSALEIGCGPGTGSIALALWAADRAPVGPIVATDKSEGGLAVARRLGDRLGLANLVTARLDVLAERSSDLDRVRAVRPQGFGLVVLMNVVNELGPRDDGRVVSLLDQVVDAEGLVIVVEPAARAQSRRALGLRDRLVDAGWCVWLPCTRGGRCPALSDGGDWCHGEWSFQRPPFMRRVDQLTGTRREVLKATWFVVGRTPRPESVRSASVAPGHRARIARVVSERLVQKGRSRIVICTEDGRCFLELQKRDRRPNNADFDQLVRHDLIGYSATHAIPDGWRLDATDTCRRLVGGGD